MAEKRSLAGEALLRGKDAPPPKMEAPLRPEDDLKAMSTPLKPAEEELKKKKKAPAEEEEAPLGGEEEEEAPLGGEDEEEAKKKILKEALQDGKEAPDLSLDVFLVVAARLPTKAAYGCTVLCKPLCNRLCEPPFLKRHLAPPPPCTDDVADGFLLQPASPKPGYTHLIIVSTDPASIPILLNLGEHAPPADATSPAEGDFVTFFKQTVPMLDVSVVGSDGRLLLARSATGSYYVCFPGANRWIALPPAPPAVSDRDTAVGFHYDVTDVEPGTISFKVVLLATDVVATFSSETAKWKTKGLGVHDAALCLGTTSPGIHAGNSIYWLRASDHGRVLCFDVARGHVSVLEEPPRADGSTKRVGRSLGSAGGRLRLCAFDIRDDELENVQPHAIEGVHGLWLLDDAGAWQRVHETVVRDGISASFFHVPDGLELPVDFAGASGSSVIINKNHTLLRRDLKGGDKVKLLDLKKNMYGHLYDDFDAFPLFK